MSEIEESLEEQEANPYNAKKSWHKPDGPQTQSADSLFYEGQATPQQEAPDEEEQNAPPKRKRANYKKRYDDLKKHYDDRVSQFKQREQELLAENRASQPEYKAPKTSEDLQKFKTDYPDNLTLQETLDRIGQENTAFEASQGYIDRKFIPNVNFNITDKRIAEINEQNRLKNEAAKRLQIRSQTRSFEPG